ncbi:DUF6515 family protein [Cyclobacterium sediminis]
MKNIIKISSLLIFLLSVSIPEMATAQKSRESKKVVVINKENRRAPSKKVVYKKPNKKVITVRTLPDRTVIKHKGIHYYYANNKFYTYSGGRYIAIAPKKWFRIKTLPIGYIRVKHPQRNYFWFNGIFYIQIDNAYEVVAPEVGTIIYELPKDHEKVTIDGYTYYEFSNVLYEKIQIDGTRAYEVVGFIDQ